MPKLNEAKNAYQKKRDEIENRAKLLPAEIAKAKSLAPKPGVPQTPQQQQAYQQAMTMVKAKVDKIADDYMTLGKDLLYIAYRLERILMYHQMHHLAVTARTEHTHLTREKLEQDTRQYFELEKGAYENALWDKVVNLQIP